MRISDWSSDVCSYDLEADPILVLHQLAHGADAPVPQIVDVVDFAPAVLQVEQDLQDRENVLLAEHAQMGVRLEAEAGVTLDPADRRKVVALMIEEQAVEQRLAAFQRRRHNGRAPCG